MSTVREKRYSGKPTAGQHSLHVHGESAAPTRQREVLQATTETGL